MGHKLSKSPSAIAEDLVRRTVRENKVVVFSKSRCGYCAAAKQTLSAEAKRLRAVGCVSPSPAVVKLDDGSIPPDVAREVQRVLGRMTGAATVPRVFVEETLVGGAAETVKYARSGGLRLALMKAGRCDVYRHQGVEYISKDSADTLSLVGYTCTWREVAMDKRFVMTSGALAIPAVCRELCYSCRWVVYCCTLALRYDNV